MTMCCPGRAPAARHAALLPAADDGGVPRRGRQARHLARAARSPAAAPPAPARDTRVRLVHTQVSILFTFQSEVSISTEGNLTIFFLFIVLNHNFPVQVSSVRSCLGAAVHRVPADVLRPPRHRARAHGLRVRAAEVLRGVRRGVLLGARQRGRHPRQVQCSWPGPPQAAPRVETFKQVRRRTIYLKYRFYKYLPICCRTLKQLRPTDRLRPTLPRICEESDGGHAASRGRGGMSRLRSASECSLESVESDSDAGLHAAGAASSSDPESDIEMEVITEALVVTQFGWGFKSHPDVPPTPSCTASPLPLS